jgi:hypothetical protein
VLVAEATGCDIQMGDIRIYTAKFVLADEFSARFNALNSKIRSITDMTHNINFDVNNDILEKTAALGQTVHVEKTRT